MLGKLLKHDFRAAARLMLPVYLLLFATAGLFNLFMHLTDRYNAPALEVFRTVSGVLFVITVLAAGIVTVCLMVYRFYRNYMTDEGYLMFTLPATTGQLLWSKLVVAMVWSAFTLAAILLAVLLGTAGLGVWENVFPSLRDALLALRELVSPGQMVALLAEFVVLTILGTLSSYLMFFAAISLGHSFSNHKILCSIGLYIVFHLATQILSSSLGIYGIVIAARAEIDSAAVNPLASAHGVMLGSVLLSLISAAVFYLITYFSLRKRLNLQ